MYGLSPDAADHIDWLEDKNKELEQENAELTQALERACETIAEICHWTDCQNDCPVSEGCTFGAQEPECIKKLIKHFKEIAQ